MPSEASLRADSYGDHLPGRDQFDDIESHTPTPWRTHVQPGGPGQVSTVHIVAEGHARTAPCVAHVNLVNPDSRQNANLIIRAVNAHAALIEALEMFECATDSGDPDDYIVAEREMKKALKLARGDA